MPIAGLRGTGRKSGSKTGQLAERANRDREGVCLFYHQKIPNESAAVWLLHHVAEQMDEIPKINAEHTELIHENILLAACGQAIGL